MADLDFLRGPVGLPRINEGDGDGSESSCGEVAAQLSDRICGHNCRWDRGATLEAEKGTYWGWPPIVVSEVIRPGQSRIAG